MTCPGKQDSSQPIDQIPAFCPAWSQLRAPFPLSHGHKNLDHHHPQGGTWTLDLRSAYTSGLKTTLAQSRRSSPFPAWSRRRKPRCHHHPETASAWNRCSLTGPCLTTTPPGKPLGTVRLPPRSPIILKELEVSLLAFPNETAAAWAGEGEAGGPTGQKAQSVDRFTR